MGKLECMVDCEYAGTPGRGVSAAARLTNGMGRAADVGSGLPESRKTTAVSLDPELLEGVEAGLFRLVADKLPADAEPEAI
jgi:hypothetical protein